jgi:hypothetical protein
MSIGDSSYGEGDRLETVRAAQGPGPRRSGNRPALGRSLGDLLPGEAEARGLAERVSVQTPGVSEGVSKTVSKRLPIEVLPSLPATSGSPEMTPLLQEILQELRTLTRGLAGRVSEQVSQWLSLGPREKTERWSLHLPQDVIAQTKARAQALGVHPSELVAEVLRRWLAEGEAS